MAPSSLSTATRRGWSGTCCCCFTFVGLLIFIIFIVVDFFIYTLCVETALPAFVSGGLGDQKRVDLLELWMLVSSRVGAGN